MSEKRYVFEVQIPRITTFKVLVQSVGDDRYQATMALTRWEELEFYRGSNLNPRRWVVETSPEEAVTYLLKELNVPREATFKEDWNNESSLIYWVCTELKEAFENKELTDAFINFVGGQVLHCSRNGYLYKAIVLEQDKDPWSVKPEEYLTTNRYSCADAATHAILCYQTQTSRTLSHE